MEELDSLLRKVEDPGAKDILCFTNSRNEDGLFFFFEIGTIFYFV
jgi:hypothetical protein